MDLLKTLLIVYTSILLLNGCLSAFFIYNYKEKLHRLALYMWLASFLNFCLQGVFQVGTLKMIMSFSTYFICSIILSQILATAQGFKLPLKKYAVVMALGLAGTFAAYFFGLGFTLTALPTAIGVSYPMFQTALSTFFHKEYRRSKITKFYCVLLFLNATHFMDYPFLRENPNTSILGFTVALMLLVLFSILLPSFILQKIADEYSSQLENEVCARTNSLNLANRQLTTTNQELDRKNAELQTLTEENRSLLSIVCHDIGNPLQVIYLNLENLIRLVDLQSKDGPQVEQTYKKLLRSCEDVADILAQARTLHAVKVGKVQLRLSNIDLNEVMSDLHMQFEDKLKAKEIKLNYVSKLVGAPYVLAEQSTLKNQVFSNLISNAIKFSHPNSEINVTAELKGELIHLLVSDRGVGMSKDTIENMFNLDSSTTHRGTQGERGTGFGLSIVKSYLSKYGAQIDVESRSQEEGSDSHGTDVHIYFRRAA